MIVDYLTECSKIMLKASFEKKPKIIFMLAVELHKRQCKIITFKEKIAIWLSGPMMHFMRRISYSCSIYSFFTRDVLWSAELRFVSSLAILYFVLHLCCFMAICCTKIFILVQIRFFSSWFIYQPPLMYGSQAIDTWDVLSWVIPLT